MIYRVDNPIGSVVNYFRSKHNYITGEDKMGRGSSRLREEQVVLEQDEICWDPGCKRVINAGEVANCIAGEVFSGYGAQKRKVTFKRCLHPGGCQGPEFKSSLSQQRIAELGKR